MTRKQTENSTLLPYEIFVLFEMVFLFIFYLFWGCFYIWHTSVCLGK